MKKWTGALALLLLPAAGLAEETKHADKKNAAPFYAKYLVKGNALDDQIVEQAQRVAASPQDAGLRNDFGNLLARRRFPEEAAEQYVMAAKLDPANFISFYNLGLLRETEGKTRAAISAYKKSIARKPGFPPSRFRLGRLYEHGGRYDAAVEEYAEAMRIDPSMRDLRRNPLVADTELLFLASVVNYRRDLAVASLGRDDVYADENRFRKVPVDRSVAAEEIATEEDMEPAPAPREIGPGSAAGAIGTEGGARPPARRGARPNPSEVGTAPGGRVRPPVGARPTKMRSPVPPPGAAAPPPTPLPPSIEEPGEISIPENVPEPTPTPGPPPEVEPS